MSCILNIAQAYEVFFSLYFRVEILFKPFAAESDMNVEKLNSLGEKLYNMVKRYGFTDMRALFLQHIVKGCSPGNFTEAEMLLSSFPKPQMPTDKAIKSYTRFKISTTSDGG
jgi:hypothetical protein